MRFVLASKSPSRRELLRRAGIPAEVMVSDADETGLVGETPLALTRRLAAVKARTVLSKVAGDAVIVGCDSLLEIDGQVCGKPGTPEAATAQWRAMRGRSGVLHTGHCVIVRSDDEDAERSAVASTVVHFADVTDDEIRAYVATGEPLHVAGAFTIDGYGAGFITGIEGDPHNVVGLSIPLLRDMLGDLGIPWPSLWDTPTPG